MQAVEKDYFRAFISVSKAISSSLNLKEVLDLILRHGINSMDMKAGAINLWNKKKNLLELVTQRNLSQEFIRKGPVLADKSIPDVITTKAPVVVENIEKDCQLQYPEECKKEGIQSILSIPIIFKDNVIGVLRLYDSKTRQYSFREVEFITALAEQGAIAIENARYMEKVIKGHEEEVGDLWDWFSSMTGSSMLDG